MHPGVIECSPPKVIGKSFLFKIFSLVSDIFFMALIIFLSILFGSFLSKYITNQRVSLISLELVLK